MKNEFCNTKAVQIGRQVMNIGAVIKVKPTKKVSHRQN